MSSFRRRLMMLAGVGGSPTPPPLPPGYTALEYVENALGNSAYIKTGVIASASIGYYIDALSYDEMVGTSGGPYGCLFGGRYSSNNGDFQLTTFTASTTPNWSGTVRRGRSSENYDAHLPYQTRFQASLVGNTYSIGGTDYTISGYMPNSQKREIYLFALNNNGAATQNGHLRVYRFWLTDNGTKVIDYYPCMNSNNVKGFYDLVNEVFVPPTSGTFTGGIR